MKAERQHNWHSMSDDALSKTIGEFVKHHRIEQNLPQEKVAHDSNISRSTLSLLEKGESGSIRTLIQVLRTLDLLYLMDGFLLSDQISPLALAKLQENKRERAGRTKKDNNNTESSW